MPRGQAAGPPAVTVKVERWPGRDFAETVIAELPPGGAIFCVLPPLYLSAGIQRTGADHGDRWEAPGGGLVAFAVPPLSQVDSLDASKAPYLIAADLLLLRTTDARVEPAGTDGFVQASSGQLWIRIPGYSNPWPQQCMRSQPGLVDLDRLVWVRGTASSLPVVTGVPGQRWLQLAGDAHAMLHTYPR